MRRVSTDYRDFGHPTSRAAESLTLTFERMDGALNIDKSVTGQPWRWRRPADAGLGMDELLPQPPLARGVPREDLRAPS